MTARTIEQLKTEYEQLNVKKITAEAGLVNAEEQLRKLQTEAEEAFGTSDVNELSEKLEQMETENEKRRSEYQTLLDKISGELAEVEEATTEAASDSA